MRPDDLAFGQLSQTFIVSSLNRALRFELETAAGSSLMSRDLALPTECRSSAPEFGHLLVGTHFKAAISLSLRA